MPVVAPPPDTAGQQLDSAIASLQAVVNANVNKLIEYNLRQQLRLLQVEAVDHYMVTGWLAAYVILATYQPPPWDKTGQAIKNRVAYLQALVNNPPAIPPGNANGYGSNGWTTVLQGYQTMLYAKQIELVEHIMNVPGGTTAATMLANLTGFQSFPFEYVYTSVGYTNAAIE